MGRELVTRGKLRNELAKNALTKPLNVGIAAAVVVAAIVLHAIWLAPIALVVYLGLSAATFFDGKEAKKVGDAVYARARGLTATPALAVSDLAPPIASALEAARREEHRIREATSSSTLPTIESEVAGLMQEMEKLARRAQTVYAYLEGCDDAELQSRTDRVARELERAADDRQLAVSLAQTLGALQEQAKVQEQLRRQLDRFYAQMEHIVATLGTIGGQLVRMGVAEEAAAQDELAGRVRSLREEIGTVAAGLDEAYGQLDASK